MFSLTTGPTDSAAVGGELDRLIADLDAHMRHEEEQLVPTLNALST